MNFDFFEKLKGSTNDENRFQDLMEDIDDFLTSKFSREDSKELVIKEKSLLQELQEQGKVTTEYRDKMLLERSNILNRYAKETMNEGTMFFVYSKSSSKTDTFNLCVCEDGMSGKIISLDVKSLPNGVGVDSVLRQKDGKYILDEKASKHIYYEMEEMTKRLLEEQNSNLELKRIDGNVYEIVEVSGDSILLTNKTLDDGECFEEIKIPKETLADFNAGDLILYINGEYKSYMQEV